VFESIRTDDGATRLRNAAIPPLAAFLFAQIYVTATPFLPRVPAWLFWSVTVLVLAGAVGGAMAIARGIRSGPLDRRAAVRLVAALACELACLGLWMKMVFPWI
jgi:hypothetical protein